MARPETPLGGVLDDLQASGRESAVSVGEVLEVFEPRSASSRRYPSLAIFPACRC